MNTVYENEAKKMVKKEAEQKRKSALQKLFQKKRYQKQYQAAKQSKKAKDAAITSAQKFTEKAKDAVKMIAAQNRGIFATVAIFGLIFVLIAASFTSCSASLQELRLPLFPPVIPVQMRTFMPLKMHTGH